MDRPRLDPDVVALRGPVDSSIQEAIEAAGLSVRTDAAAGADVVLAVGEAGLLETARADLGCPILPVDAGPGVRSVVASDVPAALASLPDDATVETHPLLSVLVGGEPVSRALFDVMLATATPAHISEFGVGAGEERAGVFRADGVVAATPAGTAGYARAAGSPIVPTGPEVVSVVPVAPFETSPDQWVLPVSEVTLTVQREEAAVDLAADGDRIRSIGADDPVTLAVDHTVEVVRLPQSTSPFGDGAAKSEKL